MGFFVLWKLLTWLKERSNYSSMKKRFSCLVKCLRNRRSAFRCTNKMARAWAHHGIDTDYWKMHCLNSAFLPHGLLSSKQAALEKKSNLVVLQLWILMLLGTYESTYVNLLMHNFLICIWAFHWFIFEKFLHTLALHRLVYFLIFGCQTSPPFLTRLFFV